MDSYFRVENTFFQVLRDEKMRIQRKKLNHHRKNKTRSALALLSNKLLGLGKRKRMDGKKPIIFFGNGSWRPSREGGPNKGVGAMPRKALVKEISQKGMCVIESEYRTSKCCFMLWLCKPEGLGT